MHKSFGKRRSAFTLVELLVVIAIIGILVALLLPAIQSAREAARRTKCIDNVKNLALACLNYESARKVLPPGAVNANEEKTNGVSWAFLLLPYLEEGSAADKGKQDFAANNGNSYQSSINETRPVMYTCPSDVAIEDMFDKFSTTVIRKGISYAGVCGSYASRVGGCTTSVVAGKYCLTGTPSLIGNMSFDGLLIQDTPVSLKKVSDGTSKTLLLGERWYQMRAWTVGAYYSGSQTKVKGPQAETAFSACKNVDKKVPLNINLATACYISHTPGTDRPDLPLPLHNTLTYNSLPFASFHTGGVNFCFGDGSVRFFTDDLDGTLYEALGSRNGAETVSE
jgi:prepilin-type N-terminal cleavage/methylation domain-containing protein/prepilin-type processing-associated H-X9-DG protein